MDGEPTNLGTFTAQIHNDFLYVFSAPIFSFDFSFFTDPKKDRSKPNPFWRFDISKRILFERRGIYTINRESQMGRIED